MGIPIDRDEQTKFDKELESTYGYPPETILSDLGKTWGRMCSVYGWVPAALREIANFLEEENGNSDSDDDTGGRPHPDQVRAGDSRGDQRSASKTRSKGSGD